MKKSVLLFFSIFAAFIFFSCNLSLDADSKGADTYITLSFGDEALVQERYVILPDFEGKTTLAQFNITKLNVYMDDMTGAPYETFDIDPAVNSIKILVSREDHIFRLEGLDQNGNILLKSDEKELKMGTGSNFSIPLMPYTEHNNGEKGSVNIKIFFPPKTASTVSYKIKCDVDGTSASEIPESGLEVELENVEKEQNFTINDLTPGVHNINFTVFSNSYSKTISCNAIVYANFTSSTVYSNSTKQGDSLTFTHSEMKPLTIDDYAVCVNGTGGIFDMSDDEENDGKISGTLHCIVYNTVSEAVNFVSNASGWKDADDYTVYISGHVKATDEELAGYDSMVNVNLSGKTINLVGCSSGAVLDADSKARVLKVTSGNVRIKDLTLTGGKAFSGNGGGINIEGGAVELCDGAKVTGNECTGNGKGVCVSDGSFKISGSGYVQSTNDIYLSEGKIINIEGTLTPPSEAGGVVGKITPKLWKRGTQLLGGAVSDNISKFALDGTNWSIADHTTSGELYTDYKIYVSGSEKDSSFGDGNDDTGDGTKSKPYASIKKAVEQCWYASEEFTICVSGILSAAQEIPAASGTTGLASSIIIEGFTGNSKDMIDRNLSAVPDSGSGSCLTVNTITPVTIKKFKLTRGYAENGGGIYCNKAKAKITLDEGALVTSNSAKECGGGVYIEGTGTGADQKATFEMASTSKISVNTAKCTTSNISDIGGGGVYLKYAIFSMTDNTSVENNNADVTGLRKGGGGICAISYCNLTMSGNSAVSGNTGAYGGGIFADQYVYICMIMQLWEVLQALILQQVKIIHQIVLQREVAFVFVIVQNSTLDMIQKI